MTQSIQTLQHRVSESDDDSLSQNRQIGCCAEALSDHARVGYRLTHTATVESVEYVLLVDTLVRDSE